jgi:hypothetical protein
VRKRIAILIIAAVAIGSVAVLLFKTQERSIDYHKRAYLNAQNGSGAVNRIRRAVSRATGWSLFKGQIPAEKIRSHENALIELGYLEERECYVSNRSPHAIVMPAYRAGRGNLNADFVRLGTRGTNIVTVVAPASDAPEWEQLVYEADASSKAR